MVYWLKRVTAGKEASTHMRMQREYPQALNKQHWNTTTTFLCK